MSINREDLIFEIAAARFYAAAAGRTPANLGSYAAKINEENARVADYLIANHDRLVDVTTTESLAEEIIIGFIGQPPSGTYDQVDAIDSYHWSQEWDEIKSHDLDAIIAQRLLETNILQGANV